MRAQHRVLVVDDDEGTRRVFGRALIAAEYDCTVAASCSEARGLLTESEFSLVICGLRIGGESGLDLVHDIRSERRDTAVVVASDEDDLMLAEIALDNGAFGFMLKPLTANQLLIDVSNALYRRRVEQQNEVYRRRLEEALRDRATELRAAIEGLRHSQEETARRLSRAVEVRDLQMGGHLERIGNLSELLGVELGLPVERVEFLRIAAPMHDVGKMGIPDRILLKPTDLTEEERREMKRHAEIGYKLLCDTSSELLAMAAAIALTHHERFDGTGYPRGLVGEEIPIEGRIVAVADVFDALTSDRVYRPAFSRLPAGVLPGSGGGQDEGRSRDPIRPGRAGCVAGEHRRSGPARQTARDRAAVRARIPRGRDQHRGAPASYCSGAAPNGTLKRLHQITALSNRRSSRSAGIA
jgi:putative two-component system response regulator